MSRRAWARAATISSLVVAYAPCARAADSVAKPESPQYRVEIEPRADVGVDRVYGSAVFGAGLQLAVPIVKNGLLAGVRDNVALAAGADIIRYSGCVRGTCGGTVLLIPAAIQWNFFVADRWSFFGEPGIFLYHGLFAEPLSGSRTGIGPVIDVGARYHFTDGLALTMRLGYPTTSLGLSFM